MKDDTERLRRNAESKAMAEFDGQEWTHDDQLMLLEFFKDAKGDPQEEAEVARTLGRTIEACRQRFYEVASGRMPLTVRRTTTEIKTTTTEYVGVMDDPDDCWWSPDYYTGRR